MGVIAVAYATTLLLNMNEGWDSEEYAQAAVQTTSQVAAQIAISEAVKAGLINGTAGAGIGAAAAYVISASINDLFADDHMDSHHLAH